MKFKYVEEYGTSEPARLLNNENLRSYDGNGNEIIMPKCDKCQCFKAQLVGSNGSTWVCTSCGGQ